MSAPNGWKVSAWLLGAICTLLSLLYADARGDIGKLDARLTVVEQDITAIKVGISEIRVRVEGITRIERKLDDLLDRPSLQFRPGPR